ncbi:MAG: hypothetical protein QM820_03465 [Minicystis sp.]
MQALRARRPSAPPTWDEILEAALVQLNRHGAEWIERWPGPIHRLYARSSLGAVAASSGGASPEPRALAVVGRALEHLSLSYRDADGGMGRKPHLDEVLYYLRDVTPWGRTPPAEAPGRADLLYLARHEMTGAPLPSNATVEFEMGVPPTGFAPGEVAATSLLADGARWWIGDAGESVCEASADLLRDKLGRDVDVARDGEPIPFESFLHALFDLSRNDFEGFFEDSPTFQGRALSLHAGEGEPRLVVRELSDEALEAMEGCLSSVASYVCALSDLYLAEAGRKPRVAEVFACVSYALNLLDLSGWLSDVPEERPLWIRIGSP